MFRNPIFACALLIAPLSLIAQEQPAPAPSTPAPAQQPTATQPAPPARPAVKGERDAFSIGLYGWYGPGKIYLRKGSDSTSTRAGDLDFNERKRKPFEGAVVTIPIRENYLRISYFQAQNSGNTTAGKDLNLFAGDYDKGTFLATRYKVQNAKISFDYLSWPFPFEGRKFRIRTLWEAQFVNAKGSVDAPLKPVAEGDTNATNSNKFLIWPSLGAGAEYRFSKSFRFEATGSGFAIPKRPNLWDAHAGFVARVGRIELSAGGKGFHFRQSRKTENFFNGTLLGAYVGVAYRFE
jgi:hypothetical protein